MKKARKSYSEEKNAWFTKHTDPVFGRPVDRDGIRYFELARASWDTKHVLNEYRVPFSFRKDGFVVVTTDEFPILDQKFIFEWMTKNMDAISNAVPELLRTSSNGSLQYDEMSKAFSPDRISHITFEGSGPVVWKIQFDTNIGEGEALRGKVCGKDQNIEFAALFM